MSETPVVIEVSYKDEGSQIASSIAAIAEDISGHALTEADRRHLEEYPTVYVIRSERSAFSDERGDGKCEYIVYVGETNSIVRRTGEHYNDESVYRTGENKRYWHALNEDASASMYVVAHGHFNKSLTLDLENTFMSYVLASGAKNVRLINSRGNPQNDYYTHDELPRLVSQAWRKLNRYEPELFPAETVIRDSAIFKASPFHRLGDEQRQAESVILAQIKKELASGEGRRSLILVEGAAGTGKTVLISHLFYQIENQFHEDAAAGMPKSEANLIINHDEQQVVYDTIMMRLGLQKKPGIIVKKPTQFINQHSEPGHGNGLDHQDYPANPIDVALIDEAHLLLNQGNQGYRGSRNMLVDILKRARVVVAVYDPKQVLRRSQEIDPIVLRELFPAGRIEFGQTVGETRCASVGGETCRITNVVLKHQFRIDACEEIIEWIDAFATGAGVGPIPHDHVRDGHIPYEIKIFDSPFELKEAIVDRAITFDQSGRMVDDDHNGLSRVLATYDWRYSSKSRPKNGDSVWEVKIYQEHAEWIAAPFDDEIPNRPALESQGRFFHMPWNYEAEKEEGESIKGKAWAEQPHTLGECGSIYTIQGFDLNIAGVIIGPSVKYRNGRIVFDVKSSCNNQAIAGSKTPEENLRHELNVLLKRGVHGLYLFAVDTELRNHLYDMAAAG